MRRFNREMLLLATTADEQTEGGIDLYLCWRAGAISYIVFRSGQILSEYPTYPEADRAFLAEVAK